MLVAASEGQGFRYEVVERTEGYLVRSRCLNSGAVDDAESKLFRTAAVAFRYAEMSAAFDRYASARMAGEDAASELGDLEAQQTLFRGSAVASWTTAWRRWCSMPGSGPTRRATGAGSTEPRKRNRRRPIRISSIEWRVAVRRS